MTSLSNNGIFLAELKMSYAREISLMANNWKIWKNVRDIFPHPYSLEDAEKFISLTIESDHDHVFVIKKDNALCGVIGLHAQSDVYSKSGEIGYWLGEEYWGQGLATSAVGLITEYGFTALGLVRLFAGVFEYNKASMWVLEKNGFVLEGIKKKSVFKLNKLWDEYMYARLHLDHI